MGRRLRRHRAHQVRGKLHKLLGKPLPTFGRSLEIGAGTGYFTLNMLQDGVVREAVATDISPGMLDALQANAQRIGVARARPSPATPRTCRSTTTRSTSCSGTRCCTTSPTSTARSRSSGACCAPGGELLFAGEPSQTGDRIAAYPKRAGAGDRAAVARVMRARPAEGYDAPDGHGAWPPTPGELDGESLEPFVDVHAFTPGELGGLGARRGLRRTSRVRGEELLANWFGWMNRTLEATARPEDIPWLWRQYAFRGYLAAAARRRRAARGTAAAGGLLQPHDRGTQAGLIDGEAAPGLRRMPAP